MRRQGTPGRKKFCHTSHSGYPVDLMTLRFSVIVIP
jgi:hypothetical protein